MSFPAKIKHLKNLHRICCLCNKLRQRDFQDQDSQADQCHSFGKDRTAGRTKDILFSQTARTSGKTIPKIMSADQIFPSRRHTTGPERDQGAGLFCTHRFPSFVIDVGRFSRTCTAPEPFCSPLAASVGPRGSRRLPRRKK